MPDKTSSNGPATPSSEQLNLLELVDRVSSILAQNQTPEQTAQSLRAEYDDFALDIAEACALSFPGKRGSNKRAFWETVSAILRKDVSTSH